MIKLNSIIIVAILLLFPVEVFSCVVDPPEYSIDYQIMLKQAKSIYLGRAILKKLVDKKITTTFKVIESIRGESVETLQITYPGSEYDPVSMKLYMYDFNLHKDKNFWEKDSTGRMGFLLDCRPSVSFRLGYAYLIFPEFASSAKAMEIINDTSDKWYRRVKEASVKEASKK